MTTSDVEVLVRGSRGVLAADAVALGLMAAGACVDFPARVNVPAKSDQTLRGCCVRVHVVQDGDEKRADPQAAVMPSLAASAKIAIGVILLLALLGAEVRLHFGPRLDTIFTLAGLVMFWRYVGKKARSAV
jgi:hypothetical protein